MNAIDKDGWTALMHAARYGRYDAADILLKNGADHTIKDESGNTAQSIAELIGFVGVAELIEKHAAKLN